MPPLLYKPASVTAPITPPASTNLISTKPLYTVIVTGARDWTDRDLVFKVLNKVSKKVDGIDGITVAFEAGVADFAAEWAEMNYVPWAVWPANPADGEEAAFKRAGRMLHRSRYASLLIAFPGGYVTDWLAANAQRLYNMRVQFVNPSNSPTPG